MSDKTSIEWTDHTFNPWWGCARVSPACVHCYADRDASRYGFELWRRHGPRRMLSEANWARPLKWNRDAERAGVPAKVFCASMADVFEDHPQVGDARARLWGLIDATPWLVWQILTKRPENIAQMAPWGDHWPPHVWMGTSVENQKYADIRIPILLDVPAQTRFLSCEPLLGEIYLGNSLRAVWKCPQCGRHNGSWTGSPECFSCRARACPPPYAQVDWVICGGESGAKRREMDPGWLELVVSQCRQAGTPVFVKQDSGPRSGMQGRIADSLWVKEFPPGVMPEPAGTLFEVPA
jgi:protein gp37